AYVVLANVDLQPRYAVAEMNESRLAHQPRWSRQPTCDTNIAKFFQLDICGVLDLRRRPLALAQQRYVAADLFKRNYPRDRILIARYLAAFKLVWVDVSDQIAQVFEMLFASSCLVIGFDDLVKLRN